MRRASKSESPDQWASDWEVAVRVWVERNGQAVLGEHKADLLAAIDRTHSITAAAKAVNLSYRSAWLHVQQINAAAGDPLVAAVVGGVRGGGAQLTPRGKLSLAVYEQLRDQVRAAAVGVLQRTIRPSSESAAAIHLAAAISLQEVIGQLLTEYALKQPAVRVRAVFGASNELADHVLAGAPCDLFVSADAEHLDRLSRAKMLRQQSRSVLTANSLSVIAPRESRLKIRKVQDLLHEKVERVVLADPAVPLGKCARDYLQKLGCYEPLAAKAILVDNSRAVLSAIASGRADAGLAFSSDAARNSDCKVLLAIEPAAASLQYSAAVLESGGRRDEAQSLLAFFATATAQQCFRRCGLLPPSRRTKKAASE